MARLPAVLRAATVALLAASATAQVSTSCQPLNTTNCPADPAFGTDYTFNFNSTPSASAWETTAGTVTYSSENGAAFTINKQGDSPTIRSKFYIFFGRTEIWMKTAPGTGIISSVMFLSDDLDEIDWEFMGGNGSFAETNYFGKGHQDYHNAIYYPVTNGTLDAFHNYTTIWTNASLDFYIDSKKVRTLLPADANNTLYYPQTPSRLSLGIWAGGDPTLAAGTREWAGGDTDYTKGPFSMYVKSVQITDYSSGKEYSYGDQTGSWQSIKITAGNSTVYESLNKEPELTLSDKWNKLPSVARTAVYASASGAGALLLIAALFYCIRQRRRGVREAALAEQRQLQERRELEEYKKAGVDPDGLEDEGIEYNARDMNQSGMASANGYSVPSGNSNNNQWAAASLSGAAAGAASKPLLQDGPSSPHADSPRSPQDPFAGSLSPQNRLGSPAPLVSPARTPSAGGMSPNYPVPPNPTVTRSFSTANAPATGLHGQVATAMPFGAPPLRSYTADPFQGPGGSGMQTGYGNGPSYGNQGGFGGNNNNNGNYWR